MASGLRRFIGNVFVTLGALNILNFFAPRPIPTVGISAFLVGAGCIVTGLIIRAERDANGKIQWKRLGALVRSQGTKKPKKKPISGGQGSADPMLAVRVLRLASDSGIPLSVAQAAMELDVTLDEAEAALDACAAKGSALIEIEPQTGIARYRFPEFDKESNS